MHKQDPEDRVPALDKLLPGATYYKVYAPVILDHNMNAVAMKSAKLTKDEIAKILEDNEYVYVYDLRQVNEGMLNLDGVEREASEDTIYAIRYGIGSKEKLHLIESASFLPVELDEKYNPLRPVVMSLDVGEITSLAAAWGEEEVWMRLGKEIMDGLDEITKTKVIKT